MQLNSFNISIIAGILIFGLLSFLFSSLFCLGFFMLMVLILSFMASRNDYYSTKRYFIAIIIVLGFFTIYFYPLDLDYILYWIFPILSALTLAVFMSKYLENLHELKKKKLEN